MSTKNVMALIQEYKERFGEPFPAWGYDDDEIVDLINNALEKGEPVKEGAETKIPKGALL